MPIIVKWKYNMDRMMCDADTEGIQREFLLSFTSFPFVSTIMVSFFVVVNAPVVLPSIILICALLLTYAGVCMWLLVVQLLYRWGRGAMGNIHSSKQFWFPPSVFSSSISPLHLNITSYWEFYAITLDTHNRSGVNDPSGIAMKQTVEYIETKIFYRPKSFWRYLEKCCSHNRNQEICHNSMDILADSEIMDWHCFEYRGEVALPSRFPEGQGEWRDSHPFGEVLQGNWVQGLPIGIYVQ